MKGIAISICAAVSAASGCAVEAPLTTSSTRAALTTGDVDFAPECAGILTYVNVASQPALDDFLPSNVASAIVARRAVRPFTSLADLSSVSGIAQARLVQIRHAALQVEFIGEECAGVFEELAVSDTDVDAILTFVDTASEAELLDVVRAEPREPVAQAIIAARPLFSLDALVAINDVGPSTFRAIRDAAIKGPFDQLADRVNAASREAQIRTAFDWLSMMFDEPGRPRSIECFGIASDIVDRTGGTIRANLADGAEVLSQATSAVAIANRAHNLGDTSAGLADLSAQVAGQTFFGCYLSFDPDPWSRINRAFFVNTVTGYRVFTDTRWSE